MEDVNNVIWLLVYFSLTADEYAQLMGNFVDIVQMHETLYCSLEECNDRVGKLFLNKAPVIKNLHQIYCAGHPKAIIIVDKYKYVLYCLLLYGYTEVN